MTFKFDWHEPETMGTVKVLMDGEASFKVHEVIETVSKRSGADMLKVVLQVTDANNDVGFIDDYILASTPWKLYNLCKAIGRPEIYTEASDGRLNATRLVGYKGRCKLKTEKSDNPNYSDRSVIASYIDKAKVKTEDASVPTQLVDDDLPF